MRDRKQTLSQSMVILPKSSDEKKSIWFNLSIKCLSLLIPQVHFMITIAYVINSVPYAYRTKSQYWINISIVFFNLLSKSHRLIIFCRVDILGPASFKMVHSLTQIFCPKCIDIMNWTISSYLDFKDCCGGFFLVTLIVVHCRNSVVFYNTISL